MHCHPMLPVVPVTTRLHRWLHKIHNRLLNEICFLDWIQLYRLLGPLNLSRGLKATPGTDASGAEWHGLGVPAEPTNIQLNLAYLSVSISVFQTYIYIYMRDIYPYIYMGKKKEDVWNTLIYMYISGILHRLLGKSKRWWTTCMHLLLSPACCLPKGSKSCFLV